MTDSSEEFHEIKASKSMSLLTTPNIDTKIIKQIGDYTLGVELGSGAFGKVVLGKHIITGETVAIKILDKIILSQIPEDYELVKKEMSILKLVKHRYIVQLYEILQTPNHIFIVMEYCDGKDIMDYILSKNFLTEFDALKYFQQLINALFYLHSQNIAHRDIKIDNILLDRNKNLKLIDFGLSTKYSNDKLLEQPCGTIVYSAPEILEGQPYHGMLVDVWSSGIVLYGMLSGYLPFSDKDDNINKKLIIEGKIEMPEFISPWVKDLLIHMLDVNPITRYTLQDIKEHPWFNMNDFTLIQGIIIGYHKIPVDEKILDLCEHLNYDKNKIRKSIINNKFDSGTALYYLLVRQRSRKGITSVSDLYSKDFINFIYDDRNLIENNKNKKENKKENKDKKKKDENKKQITENIISNKKNEKLKNKDNIYASPELGFLNTPKKIENKKNDYRGKTPKVSNENYEKQKQKNNDGNINKDKIKKYKKIQLLSSINKKKNSKIKRKNNYIPNFSKDNKKNEYTYSLNISKIYNRKKSKNKIKLNSNNKKINHNKVLNNCKKFLHNHNINNYQSKIKFSKETYSPNIKEKLIFINKKQTPIKIRRKENIRNSLIESVLSSDTNQPLSLKEFKLRNIEDNYSSASNSNIFKNQKNSNEKMDTIINYSKNNTQKLPNPFKKVIKINNNYIKKIKREYRNSLKNNIDKFSKLFIKYSKSNNKKNFYTNIEQSSNKQTRKSKSNESNENKTETFNNYYLKDNNKNMIIYKEKFNKKNEENKFRHSSKLKNEKNSKKKNKTKNSNSINKKVRNTINYMSNNVSSTNSQKKIKTINKFQNRNNRNGTLGNYTNSCSYSTININNKSKASNNLHSNKNTYVNNFSNFNDSINNKRISNLKQKIVSPGQYDISYNLIFDSNDTKPKYKSPNSSGLKTKKSYKSLKSFYNNNIKLLRKNKKEKIRKNYNIFGINNNILKEIKDKIYQNIKKSEIESDKKISENNSINTLNSVIPVKKHNNKIINKQNQNNNKENISIILLNPKSIKYNENLTSPSNCKIKTKIQYRKDNLYEEKKKKNKNRNRKSSDKKRYFESSVITYRHKSPIVIRGLSDSPNYKYLNDKIKYTQIPWKIKKKGIDEKLSEEMIYKRYIHKIKKNPFIINNNKIKKIKIKNIKIQIPSYNKQKSCSLNKNKKKSKIKFNNNLSPINAYNSKDKFPNSVLNINYKTNFQKNKNFKNKEKEINNESLNLINIKTFPLIKAINKNYFQNLNKKIYHRNINFFNINNTTNINNTNNNINNTFNTNNNYFYNFSVSASLSMNSILNMKEKPKLQKFETFIFDLSCLIIGKNNLNECCNSLIDKLKKNDIYYIQKKNNLFSCNKNGEYCDILIEQLYLENDDIMNNNENKEFTLFYYKIFQKKRKTNINKIFSKIILNP